MDELRSIVSASIRWEFFNKAFNQVISLAIGLGLARLLFPEDFGLITMVSVITGVFFTIQDWGLGSALVQRGKIEKAEINSVFWAILLWGAFLSILIILLAPLIARFYEIPKLRLIAVFLGVEFFILTLAIVPTALLQKELQFRRLFTADISGLIISGCAALFLAFQGWGVMSLVARGIMAALVKSALYWWFCGWRPEPAIRFDGLKHFFSFSLPLTGTRFLNYLIRNVDDLLVGKFLGGAQLGIYNRGYAFLLLPQKNVSRVLSNVLFPVFSRHKGDNKVVQEIFLDSTKLISAVTFPFAAILFLFSAPLVEAVLGKSWIEIAPIIKIFAILGATQSVVSINGAVFLSQGATRMQFKLGLATQFFVVGAIAYAVIFKRDVEQVALYYAVASIIISIPESYFAGRLIRLNFYSYLGGFFRIAVYSFIMGAAMVQIGNLGFIRTPVISLLGSIIAGVCVYSVFLFFFEKKLLKNIKSILAI